MSERTPLLSDASTSSRSRPPPLPILVQPRYHSLTPSSPTAITPRTRTRTSSDHSPRTHNTHRLSPYLMLYALAITCVCVALLLQQYVRDTTEGDDAGDGGGHNNNGGVLFTRKSQSRMHERMCDEWRCIGSIHMLMSNAHSHEHAFAAHAAICRSNCCLLYAAC